MTAAAAGVTVHSSTPPAGRVAYVPHDATATLDLQAVKGRLRRRCYDPRAGTWARAVTVAGGGRQSFDRPAGAAD